MKKLFPILFIVIVCSQACDFRVNEPNRPTNPPDEQPEVEDPDSTTSDDLEQTADTIIVVVGDTTNNDDIEPPISNGEDTTESFVPTTNYEVATIDGVMTFNVYLGLAIDQMETTVLIRDFPAEGGEIIFNIYTNNLYMSMYGFEKYRTDFYTFSSEPPYCGYSSYSLDTQAVCNYKMIIIENKTGVERVCSGYWACNDGGSFYSLFRIVLYQNCK